MITFYLTTLIILLFMIFRKNIKNHTLYKYENTGIRTCRHCGQSQHLFTNSDIKTTECWKSFGKIINESCYCNKQKNGTI